MVRCIKLKKKGARPKEVREKQRVALEGNGHLKRPFWGCSLPFSVLCVSACKWSAKTKIPKFRKKVTTLALLLASTPTHCPCCRLRGRDISKRLTYHSRAGQLTNQIQVQRFLLTRLVFKKMQKYGHISK